MKKQIITICLIIALILFPPTNHLEAAELSLPIGTFAYTCFSPNGECTDLLLEAITQARLEILIMAYSFRLPAVAQALIAAHKSGVKVEVVMDKSERHEGFTPAVMIANAGIPVYLDGKHAVMNNRVMIIDGKVVMTGSFNFSPASETMNAENILILQSKELANIYRENWLSHKQHSEKY